MDDSDCGVVLRDRSSEKSLPRSTVLMLSSSLSKTRLSLSTSSCGEHIKIFRYRDYVKNYFNIINQSIEHRLLWICKILIVNIRIVAKYVNTKRNFVGANLSRILHNIKSEADNCKCLQATIL